MTQREIAETQTTDPRSDQLLHLITQFVKHPANLPVDALAQNDADPCRLDRIHFFDPRSLTIEHHAADQFRRERRIPWAIERHLIFLFDFVARMSETLRQVAVIRQDEKAFGLRIESADIEKARQMRRQKIEDGVARAGIAARRNETGGLMQNDVEPALAVHHFAVDFDVIAFLWLRAEIRADPAVDRDPAGGNQFIAMPPRTKAGGSEETVQAHGGRRLKR